MPRFRSTSPRTSLLFRAVVSMILWWRLFIPKQHAEKYFPLRTLNPKPATSKEVLLHFEDMSGKVWRFRYSYGNSSQSYGLTKGWSRFVKEKNLNTADIVSFRRSTGPEKQLYIDGKSRTRSVLGMENPTGPVQMVRSFGVNKFKIAGSGCNGKRTREIELLDLEFRKKRRVIGAFTAL